MTADSRRTTTIVTSLARNAVAPKHYRTLRASLFQSRNPSAFSRRVRFYTGPRPVDTPRSVDIGQDRMSECRHKPSVLRMLYLSRS